MFCRMRSSNWLRDVSSNSGVLRISLTCGISAQTRMPGLVAQAVKIIAVLVMRAADDRRADFLDERNVLVHIRLGNRPALVRSGPDACPRRADDTAGRSGKIPCPGQPNKTAGPAAARPNPPRRSWTAIRPPPCKDTGPCGRSTNAGCGTVTRREYGAVTLGARLIFSSRLATGFPFASSTVATSVSDWFRLVLLEICAVTSITASCRRDASFAATRRRASRGRWV